MAKRFRFRLEAVENLRRIREQDALRALADAQTKYKMALDHKYSLQVELEKSLVRREVLPEQNTSSSFDYQLENAYITGTKQRIIQADQFILRMKKGVEKALRAMLSARRDLRAIELLREKAFQEFKKELQKKEQKQLEEFYTLRTGRQSEFEEESA